MQASRAAVTSCIVVTSSPSRSIVAIMLLVLMWRTACAASSKLSPAMYRFEKYLTMNFGTRGSVETMSLLTGFIPSPVSYGHRREASAYSICRVGDLRLAPSTDMSGPQYTPRRQEKQRVHFFFIQTQGLSTRRQRVFPRCRR